MIKKLSLTAAALALSVAIPLSASASAMSTPNGWYASALGGIAFTPSVNIPDTDGITGGKLTYKKPSWQAAAAVGFKSGQMRYEGEFLYQRSTIKSITANGFTIPATIAGVNVGLTGNTQVYAGMANVYYDFDQISESTPLNPYVGFGAGYAQVRNKATFSGTIGGVTVTSPADKEKDNVFAYQAIAGLNYNFDSNTSAQLDYRYFGTTKVNALEKRWQNHTLNLGLTVHFDSPQNA